MTWLAVVAAVNTVASVFYYLRWIAPVYLGVPSDNALLVPAGTWGKVGAYTAAAATVAVGVGGRFLLDAAPAGLLAG